MIYTALKMARETDQNKIDFIQHELTMWGKAVFERLEKQLQKLNINVTQELLHSLSYKVIAATAAHNGIFSLTFKEYGRMVDMGVGRGRKIESIKSNGQLLKNKGRKAKKWYSKTTYGMINGLIDRITWNYQEQVAYSTKLSLL